MTADAASGRPAFPPGERGRWAPGWLVGIALLLPPTAAGLGRVYVSTDTVRLGYALSAQQQRQRALAARFHQLQVELAALSAPARLVELGRQLGLGPPRPEQIVVVAGDGRWAHGAMAPP